MCSPSSPSIVPGSTGLPEPLCPLPDGGDGTVFLAAPSEGPATKVEALCRLLGATQASGDIRILLSVTVCSLLPSTTC